tara:strand:- start:1449 stop:1901 length:453 start_codon:yes stop_codon:yes gene_type:complete
MTEKVLEAIELAKIDFKPLEKNGQNNFFKTQNGEPHKFSTLADINNAVKDTLYKHGLSLSYQCKYNEGLNFLETTITHLTSGQSISSTSIIGHSNSTPQQVGSGITYFRRYHIQAMLNLEADFEDDGNQASGNKTNETYKQVNKSNYERR